MRGSRKRSMGLWKRLKTLQPNTLFINSLFLMLATGVVAVLGFVFWVVVARSYAAATVGVATALLSLSGLISLLSLAGFDTTLVRFLPSAVQKHDYINSGIMVVGIISIVASVAGVLLAPRLSPSLRILSAQPMYGLAFIFFTAATALNTLTNAIFLAHKQAVAVFVINLIFSLAKVALPLAIPHGNAMTIFTLAGVAQVIGLVLSVVWIARRFGHRFAPVVHRHVLRRIKTYSLSVYLATALNLLPPMLLPLLIMHRLGMAQTAYFYMAFAIATMLYTVAYAATQAAFAEGSHDEAGLPEHLAKAARFIAVLLAPAMIATVGFSGPILRIFGGNYAEAGPLLQLFALGSGIVAVYSALGVIFKVAKRLRSVIVMNFVYAVALLGSSTAWVRSIGLSGIGWAWLVGNAAAVCAGLYCLKRSAKISARLAAEELQKSH